jgi:tRNA threonylcarbamoyladenosine biosynthesis protein TsaB
VKILAVETSSLTAGVAVMEDSTLLGEYSINHKKTHSTMLMPMIKELMDKLELLPADIDVYAASVGPGSFTGLRIGITTVKSIAYAAGKPVVSVPTLDALAYNVPMVHSLVCPIMDARNNQVYTCLYSREGSVQVKVMNYAGIPVGELMEIIKGRNSSVVFVGDGVEKYREFIKEQLGDRCEFAPGSLLLHKASSVAGLGLLKARKGELENPFDMAPFYLRKPQAERELEKRRKDSHCAGD